MIEEHDIFVLTKGLPESSLLVGDTGVVLALHKQPGARAWAVAAEEVGGRVPPNTPCLPQRQRS